MTHVSYSVCGLHLQIPTLKVAAAAKSAAARKPAEISHIPIVGPDGTIINSDIVASDAAVADGASSAPAAAGGHGAASAATVADDSSAGAGGAATTHAASSAKGAAKRKHKGKTAPPTKTKKLKPSQG